MFFNVTISTVQFEFLMFSHSRVESLSRKVKRNMDGVERRILKT